LVTGATGETARYTVQRLLETGYAVRALAHKEDERSEALRGTGAEVVVGDLLEHDDAIRATAGTSVAYFCYPVRPGLIQATAYFADAAKRVSRPLSTCRRSPRGRIPRATRHAIIGSQSAF
jgi:NAD(P)H dehydrogenase (quinone)